MLISVVMKSTRPYTMRARGEATAATRRRILAAALTLSEEKMSVEIVLADVAERAQVSVQTVLRHFGSREGLFDAVSDYAREQIAEERHCPVGDVVGAIDTIVTHYERRGDMVLRMLAQEHLDPRIRELVEHGRGLHRRWVQDVFAPQLASHADPPALTDLLVVATDVYVWKLLRRDGGLDPGTTRSRMTTMVRSLLRSGDEPTRTAEGS